MTDIKATKTKLPGGHNISVLPGHIAIIMDGNGRWAKQQGLRRVLGHETGAERVRDITTACSELGLQQLTLYAFSMENWKRPKTETSFLMDLLVKFLRREQATFRKNNIRFKAIGRLHMLPDKVRLEVNKNIQETSENTGMVLCLALSYGGRSEIADAAKQIAMETRSGKLNPDCIDENFFEKYLYTAGMGDPDLLIRTAGELRVSNFLLWQISYSEFYVSDVCWPDFSREELLKAIEAYNRRERKFGGLNDAEK